MHLYQILSLSLGAKPKLEMLAMKTTSNRRRPQNIKNGICKQQLIGSYSNFKLKLRRPNNISQIFDIFLK
jgi:hypothetical protein